MKDLYRTERNSLERGP